MEIFEEVCIVTYRQTDRKTGRQAGRQTDRQTDIQIERQTERQTGRQTDIGSNVDLDISLAHPWSSDIFPSSAVVSSAAAERRADRKEEREIQQTAITRLHNCHCNPTSIGAFWSLGDRWVETPVQIIKEVIGQRGTTEHCRIY